MSDEPGLDQTVALTAFDEAELRKLEQRRVSKESWYRADVSARLKPAVRAFYSTYTGLEGEELEQHLYAIRDKAWPIGHYPCVGMWYFLIPTITTFRAYPEALERIVKGGTVLDLGCCFGQDLRFLAADGAPSSNMYASDIRRELWDLSYELFRDRKTMQAQFVLADVLNEASELNGLGGKVDVFILGRLLHLFSLEDQVRVCKRMVSISKSNSMLLGYSSGTDPPREVKSGWGSMFLHNAVSFKEMWQRVIEETHTFWEVEVEEVPLSSWGMDPEEYEWVGADTRVLNFTLQRMDEKRA